jgi:hypothetical protein
LTFIAESGTVSLRAFRNVIVAKFKSSPTPRWPSKPSVLGGIPKPWDVWVIGKPVIGASNARVFYLPEALVRLFMTIAVPGALALGFYNRRIVAWIKQRRAK